MARAHTRIRYALAVIDDYELAKHPRPASDGLRYVTKSSLRVIMRDVRAGVDERKLCIGFTKDLADTHLYASEEAAWLDNIGLKMQPHGIRVVKLKIANREG